MRRFSQQFKQFGLVLFITLIILLQTMMVIVRMVQEHERSKTKTASQIAWQIVEISRMILVTPANHQTYAIANINHSVLTTDHALLDVTFTTKPMFDQQESMHQDLLKLHKRLITQAGLYRLSLSITPTRWINFKESNRLHFPKFEPTLLILEFMALICLWWLTLWKWRLLKPINILTKLAKSLHSPTTGLLKDIEKSPTEVQEMAQALVHMQEQVHELLQQRSLFLGLTSHDLRAILTRIKMRIELQAQDELQTKLLKNIEEMTQLLDQLLSYSSEHQKVEQQSKLDVSPLLQNIASKLHSKTGLIEVNNIKPNITLTANPIMLKMALQNIIENAVKYGSKVSLHAFSSEHETTIIVYDNGPGIPNLERHKVLDANYRGENHQQPGMGLGLTFAKNVIADLRGRIEFKHNKPKGLKVIITFQT